MKYKIGDVIRDTDAFGTVTVVDCFRSETSAQYCYCVKINETDDTMLCWEGELLTGIWTVS